MGQGSPSRPLSSTRPGGSRCLSPDPVPQRPARRDTTALRPGQAIRPATVGPDRRESPNRGEGRKGQQHRRRPGPACLGPPARGQWPRRGARTPDRPTGTALQPPGQERGRTPSPTANSARPSRHDLLSEPVVHRRLADGRSGALHGRPSSRTTRTRESCHPGSPWSSAANTNGQPTHPA